jgi:glycosyltransferase involved in cell wall biosynthesis
MKIACATHYDATSADGYGVRAFYMLQAFQEIVESIDFLGPLTLPDRNSLLMLVLRAKMHFYYRLRHKYYSYPRDSLLLKAYAREISGRLSVTDADIVLSPISLTSQPIAYLDCPQPIVIWTDTTFAAALDFYPGLERDHLCQETIRDGLANEKAALSRCSLAIYSSEWAAQSAIDYYHLDPAKVRVVPFGANIVCSRTVEDIQAILKAKSKDTCKLLFLGEDWLRKGGNVAVLVTQKLNQLGLDTELTFVGCKPPEEYRPFPNCVKFLGYLSKSTQEGSEQIDRLLSDAHFLILPTQADCTPYVIPEGNSFGLPCITTNVGGIPTMVRDHVNGKLFAKDADVNEYCQYILDIFAHYSRYNQLALSAFNEYQTRLNWSVNVETVKMLMLDLL